MRFSGGRAPMDLAQHEARVAAQALASTASISDDSRDEQGVAFDSAQADPHSSVQVVLEVAMESHGGSLSVLDELVSPRTTASSNCSEHDDVISPERNDDTAALSTSAVVAALDPTVSALSTAFASTQHEPVVSHASGEVPAMNGVLLSGQAALPPPLPPAFEGIIGINNSQPATSIEAAWTPKLDSQLSAVLARTQFDFSKAAKVLSGMLARTGSDGTWITPLACRRRWSELTVVRACGGGLASLPTVSAVPPPPHRRVAPPVCALPSTVRSHVYKVNLPPGTT